MRTTCHSEYGKLQSLYLKSATDAFVSEEAIGRNWRPLHFFARPEYKPAQEEYAQFESILKDHAEKILYFPSDPLVNMDSIYCRDASIATDHGMILCRMGKELRIEEPGAAARAFESAGIQVLGRIEAPGTLEGGDTAWLDERTLAVAHPYRSNSEGIRQLGKLLQPMGVSLVEVPLPHYKGPSDVFHLMSIFSPLDKDLALVYSPLMPIAFRQYLVQRGHQLVEVPEAEFDTMGCNVLDLEPRLCMVVSGNPRTRAELESKGCRVMEYQGKEISLKGGGGPTCLTRPLKRILP
jgi:N-dimethylarginine dimethylaminohydrolase